MIDEPQRSLENTSSHAVRGDEHAPSASSARARESLDALQMATILIDPNMIVRSYTPETTALFDLASRDRDMPLASLVHRIHGLDLESIIRQAMNEDCAVERIVSVGRDDALYVVRALPYRTNDERIIAGTVLTFVNVAPLLMAEKQQRVLVSELNHRVRNMVQVIIGLCNQILHRSADLKQFQASFMGRVQALARAYELLSRDGWKEIALVDLMRTQLSGSTPPRRYTIRGEPITLNADAALALGLVLYELATNATKYGALSNSHGELDVSWTFESEVSRGDPSGNLNIEWIERGGPPVADLTGRGFGCELIERQLEHALNGEAKFDFRETGLRVTLLIPIKDNAKAATSAVP